MCMQQVYHGELVLSQNYVGDFKHFLLIFSFQTHFYFVAVFFYIQWAIWGKVDSETLTYSMSGVLTVNFEVINSYLITHT